MCPEEPWNDSDNIPKVRHHSIKVGEKCNYDDEEASMIALLDLRVYSLVLCL